MNLIKMLTVGRSVKQRGTTLGKYKLTQPGLLPKFASSVRPSNAPAKSDRVEKLPTTFAATDSLGAIEAGKANALKTRDLAARSNSQFEKTQKIAVGQILKRSASADMGREPLASRLMDKFKAVARVFSPTRSKKKNIARPVQTEWNLEKVKVARNDLTEADLEVVRPKKRELVWPTAAEVSAAKNSGNEWIKKTRSLFKTTSPFTKNAVPENQSGKELPSPKPSELAGRM